MTGRRRIEHDVHRVPLGISQLRRRSFELRVSGEARARFQHELHPAHVAVSTVTGMSAYISGSGGTPGDGLPGPSENKQTELMSPVPTRRCRRSTRCRSGSARRAQRPGRLECRRT